MTLTFRVDLETTPVHPLTKSQALSWMVWLIIEWLVYCKRNKQTTSQTGLKYEAITLSVWALWERWHISTLINSNLRNSGIWWFLVIRNIMEMISSAEYPSVHRWSSTLYASSSWPWTQCSIMSFTNNGWGSSQTWKWSNLTLMWAHLPIS